jgi:hypothetical protein
MYLPRQTKGWNSNGSGIAKYESIVIILLIPWKKKNTFLKSHWCIFELTHPKVEQDFQTLVPLPTNVVTMKW